MVEIAQTTKATNPSLGLNLLNAINLKVGYNFPIKADEFKGATFAINFNLGRAGYYPKFKII